MAFEVIMGILLSVSGVVMTVLGRFEYLRCIRDLWQGVRTSCAQSRLARFVVLALSAARSVMAAYVEIRQGSTRLISTIGKKLKAIE